MRGGPLISIAASGASRWARHVPGLLRHDPLFRYAAIAAALALVFLAARLAQDIAGPGAIPPQEPDHVRQDADVPGDRSTTGEKPPLPGSATTPPAPGNALPTPIAPGRSLEGFAVQPAPRNNFGTLPKGDGAQ